MTVNAMQAQIWEPSAIRVNALRSAVQAACLVLLVDQTFNLPSDATDVRESKAQRDKMKQQLDKAGLKPSVMPNGKPAPGLAQKMGAAAKRIK